MTDERLIEHWLPIAEIGEESVRERRSMTALPPTYYLHVWWARRPLVACRAAILASLLPVDADREKFMHLLGIHGDPVEAKQRIDIATRKGERLGAAAYGYKRAFTYQLSSEEKLWIQQLRPSTIVLDPTAGGGSIPFESARLGLESYSNDLNPVAALIELATIAWPGRFGLEVGHLMKRLAESFIREVRLRLAGVFPDEPSPDCRPDGYLWARTITCPYCGGLIPLSPNWRLADDGTGVRLLPQTAGGPSTPGRVCRFEIVTRRSEQSEGTVSGGDARCPFGDCGRIVDGDEVKRQAQAGGMGEQLYCVVFKRKVVSTTKTGQRTEKWERGYRAPRPEDDNLEAIRERLAEKMVEWEALDIIPNEKIPPGLKTTEPMRYGMSLWRDLFSPRQLLCHGTSVEIFQEMVREAREAGTLDDLHKAAFGYLALALDTMLNYGTRSCRWDGSTSRVRAIFDRHDFAFVWSYSEMAPLITGLGYDWAFEKTSKCIQELVNLVHPTTSTDARQLSMFDSGNKPPPVTVTCQSAAQLEGIQTGSVDLIVMDPPYYDNVMYAELSDFFYVWLKRTAGLVFPELFRLQLTDKEREAVANPARFAGQKKAKDLASEDYRDKMAAIFAECRRVLKADGLMTLMFTHKATGAWDALARGLLEAGFVITASWPINTEAEGSLHVKGKAAANSTIFLVCRPRVARKTDDVRYWEDLEPQVVSAVRSHVEEFQRAGIGGVDLYLASFGPALRVLSEHWPIVRGTPRSTSLGKKKKANDSVDPYEVSPEDALHAARREVKRWRLEKLTRVNANVDLDPLTAFFVLAWDAFGAPTFDIDEALKLAYAVGVDLESEVIGHVATKKAEKITLWDSAARAGKFGVGAPDGSRAMIDALHHLAHLARTKGLDVAREILESEGLHQNESFLAALSAVLEVLPVSASITRVEIDDAATASASNDFEALYQLSRLALADRVPRPQQLSLWEE